MTHEVTKARKGAAEWERELDSMMFSVPPTFKTVKLPAGSKKSAFFSLSPFLEATLVVKKFGEDPKDRSYFEMTLMVELCRHQTAEKVPLAKCNSGAGSLDFTNEKLGGLGQKPADQPSQEKRFPVGNNLEKPMHGGTRITGTYIVGGSAFGWNFITFHGTKPEYYGRTKESFRAGK
uniref:Uncharacterized protein n=1 Tax=Chenopodium quinoa TaxID=63459 RepID=A0A803M2V1_CHEQI